LDDVGISDDEAEMLLRNDIARAKQSLLEKLPWTANLDEPRRAVLINMTFNMGINTLLAFEQTLEYVRTGNYEAASVAMLDSKWAKQVGVRADRLADQMKLGVWQ
jgi:lysozyme